MRLIFLGHSCDPSAAALAALLGAEPLLSGVASEGVGAMPASPGLIRHISPWCETALPGAASLPMVAGDAGIAPTDAISPTSRDIADAPGGPRQEIVSVILAGPPGVGAGQVERLAAQERIPVNWVRSVSETIVALRAAAPDVAVAACFPWRLPRAAREVPSLNVLNIHPSLLPAGRGPEPIFWTLRRGERVSGVTVHLLDAGFDTGPIVAQEKRPIPPGIRAPELENALMARGAALLLEALPALADGSMQPGPQSPAGVSFAPIPAASDWMISTLLPAAWAWSFARGVAPLAGPLAVIASGGLIPVSDALDWSPDERLPERVVADDDGTLRVRFSPGWVRFSRHIV